MLVLLEIDFVAVAGDCYLGLESSSKTARMVVVQKLGVIQDVAASMGNS